MLFVQITVCICIFSPFTATVCYLYSQNSFKFSEKIVEASLDQTCVLSLCAYLLIADYQSVFMTHQLSVTCDRWALEWLWFSYCDGVLLVADMPGDGSGCHGVQRSVTAGRYPWWWLQVPWNVMECCWWLVIVVMVVVVMECKGVLLVAGERGDGCEFHGF